MGAGGGEQSWLVTVTLLAGLWACLSWGCEEGDFEVDGRCHRFVEEEATQAGARQHCLSLGWGLAGFRSRASLRRLGQALRGRRLRRGRPLHSVVVDAKRRGPSDRFAWLGWPEEPLSPELWREGEPSNSAVPAEADRLGAGRLGEDCVEVDLRLDPPRLNDVLCRANKPFVCAQECRCEGECLVEPVREAEAGWFFRCSEGGAVAAGCADEDGARVAPGVAFRLRNGDGERFQLLCRLRSPAEGAGVRAVLQGCVGGGGSLVRPGENFTRYPAEGKDGEGAGFVLACPRASESLDARPVACAVDHGRLTVPIGQSLLDRRTRLRHHCTVQHGRLVNYHIISGTENRWSVEDCGKSGDCDGFEEEASSEAPPLTEAVADTVVPEEARAEPKPKPGRPLAEVSAVASLVGLLGVLGLAALWSRTRMGVEWSLSVSNTQGPTRPSLDHTWRWLRAGVPRLEMDKDLRYAEDGASLGDGAFGHVLRGEMKMKDGNWKPVALKEIRQSEGFAEGRLHRRFFRELLTHARLSRPRSGRGLCWDGPAAPAPRVLPCVGFSARWLPREEELPSRRPSEDPQEEAVVLLRRPPTKAKLYILVTELAEGGALDAYLASPPVLYRLPLTRLFGILLHMTQAQEFLQSKNLVHMDIKPDNFVVRLRGEGEEAVEEVLLCDYGHARTCSPSRGHEYTSQGDDRGMFRYRAPELHDGLAGKGSLFGFETDIWALGLSLWEVLTYCKREGLSSRRVVELSRSAGGGWERGAWVAQFEASRDWSPAERLTERAFGVPPPLKDLPRLCEAISLAWLFEPGARGLQARLGERLRDLRLLLEREEAQGIYSLNGLHPLSPVTVPDHTRPLKDRDPQKWDSASDCSCSSE